MLEVVPQGEDGEVGGADDGAGVEVDARQRHRLVDPACLNKHEPVDCWHFKYYPCTHLQLEGTVALGLHI